MNHCSYNETLCCMINHCVRFLTTRDAYTFKKMRQITTLLHITIGYITTAFNNYNKNIINVLINERS